MYMCVHHVQAEDYKGPRRHQDSLQVELQVVVRHHVGAGNQIPVLCKRFKCS